MPLLPVVLLSTSTAVLVLRRDPVGTGHVRAPAALPVGGMASCLLPLWQQEARVWGLAGLLLAGGVAPYLLTRVSGRRPSALGAARRD